MKTKIDSVPDGFYDYEKYMPDYKGFGWFGEFVFELDGELWLVPCSGVLCNKGEDLKIKTDREDFTDAELERLYAVAFKTDPDKHIGVIKRI